MRPRIEVTLVPSRRHVRSLAIMLLLLRLRRSSALGLASAEGGGDLGEREGGGGRRSHWPGMRPEAGFSDQLGRRGAPSPRFAQFACSSHTVRITVRIADCSENAVRIKKNVKEIRS